MTVLNSSFVSTLNRRPSRLYSGLYSGQQGERRSVNCQLLLYLIDTIVVKRKPNLLQTPKTHEQERKKPPTDRRQCDSPFAVKPVDRIQSVLQLNMVPLQSSNLNLQALSGICGYFFTSTLRRA